jgi:aspartate-semialdehyde dehydrogenase
VEYKIKVIRVIIGATGTVSKSFRQYLNNILRKHRELKKIAILATAATVTRNSMAPRQMPTNAGS